jgi:hypothetical protein
MVREHIQRIQYKQVELYEFDPSSELIDRVAKIPDFVLSYYRDAENMPSYVSYMPSASEMEEIERCLSRMPKIHIEILLERLIGIYFIDNFLGSGMADYVLDGDGNLYTILIFNPVVFKSSLSQYASYKENTCFFPDDPALEVKIELSDEYSGFLHILLHEATHCIDYIDRYTPCVEPHLLELQGPSSRDTAFSHQVWEDYNTLKRSKTFPYKNEITFYGFNNGPKLPVSEAVDVYKLLERSPFVSLYSSFNWAEDFAEYITYYYLTRHLELDYRVVVKRYDEVIYEYEPMKEPHIIVRSTLLDGELLARLYNPES